MNNKNDQPDETPFTIINKYLSYRKCDAEYYCSRERLAAMKGELLAWKIKQEASTAPERESVERQPPKLFSDEEKKRILQKAEWLWEDLQKNELGGYSGINRPFFILWKFKEVIEEFGDRDVGLSWSLDALASLKPKTDIEDGAPHGK